MEAIVRSSDFGNELEGCIHFILHPFPGIVAIGPGEDLCTRSEGIFAGAAEGVPVSNGKTHVFFHGLTCHYFVLIIKFKGKRIIRIPAFKFHFPDSREILFFT